MAVIGSIRKRGTLLLIVIGVSMLAFILSSKFVNLFSTGSVDTTVAVINGNKVNLNEFQNRMEEKEAFITSMNPNANLDETQRQQIAEEVWNDILRDKVYYRQYDLVGVKLTTEEEADMLTGETIHPAILQQFRNPQTGMFDPNSVVNYNNQFQEEPAGMDEEQLAQWRAQRSQWYYFKNYIREDRLSTKYNNLVTKGLYVTTKEAKSTFVATNSRANIRFVMKPYAMIPDSAITLSDEEVKNYYNEFKYKFRQKKSRSMKYALFMAIPTSQDSADIYNNMVKLSDEWKTSTDDTLFVYENAQDPSEPTYYKEGALGLMMDSLLFNTADGTVAGPFVQNGYYLLGKKLSERMMSDSVKARHILIQPKTQEEVEAKRNLRDSLFTVLQNGGNFAEIAALYSNDGSAKDTGNLGWFTEGMMVPQFNDTCFASEKGQLKKVDTQFGFHIIYIQDKTKPKKQARIGIVNKLIEPSDATMKEAYSKASEMLAVDQTAKGFDSEKYFVDYCNSKNVMVRDEPFLTESSKNLMGMDGTKDIIKWGLSAKKGEISDVFEVGYTYVVAVVTAVRIDGIPKLEDIRGEVEVRARQHKKAEQFKQEFTGAMSSGNIDGVAAGMKLQVIPGNDVTFASYFVPGAGIEPALLGVVFGSNIGKLSKPVEGNNGVFVAVVDGFTPAPEMPDYSLYRMQMLQGLVGRAANEVGTALKEKARLQDYRYKFDIF